MAALQSALAALAPEDFTNVPTAGDDLQQYMSNLFTNVEIIIESIPSPPTESSDSAASRARSKTEPPAASNASEISLSSSRSAPPSSDYEELQKQWGKPLKIKPQENPLGISVFKAAGKDGRGAWFARRSVHEGLSFSKWAKALADEFPESIAAGTHPGEGNIRGIGGERCVEHIDVEGKGQLEVYQLSAQFPGPTTPRDFITLLITSSSALGAQGGNSSRHYMIISKPCIHGQCPPRIGFIRGQYESVELIREVPRITTPNSSGAESEEESSGTNPVEWIMVTRSDPGGSVPKFMVERGTPSSICGDAVKFLDWATKHNQQDSGGAGSLTRRRSLPSWEANGHLAGLQESREDEAESPLGISTGLLAAASHVLGQGLEAYTPQVILDQFTGHSESQSLSVRGDVPDTASTTSTESFASAESHASSTPSVTEKNTSPAGQLPQFEKELRKLDSRRKALDLKISAAREKASKESESTSVKEAEAVKKAKEKQDRELKKEEERYKKELAKLESRREKELKKMEERRKRAEGKDLSKQNDILRKEVETMKKERETLFQILGELQSENTKLTARLGEVETFPAPSDPDTTNATDADHSARPSIKPQVSSDQIKRVLDERKDIKGSRFRGTSEGSRTSSFGNRSHTSSNLE